MTWRVVFLTDDGDTIEEATYRTMKAAYADKRRREAALTTTLYFCGWAVERVH